MRVTLLNDGRHTFEQIVSMVGSSESGEEDKIHSDINRMGISAEIRI